MPSRLTFRYIMYDSFMQVGLTRQGVVCEVCGFACHIQCREKVPAACPVPPDQSESIYYAWLRSFSQAA